MNDQAYMNRLILFWDLLLHPFLWHALVDWFDHQVYIGVLDFLPMLVALKTS